MALGRGYALPFVAGKQGAGGGGGAYGLLWQDAVNDNVPPLTIEDGNAGQGSCLFTRGKDLYDKQVSATPSLLIVPQIYGSGKLSVDIPSPEFFNVTRATTATRVNSSGLIESVASGVPRLDWYATPAAQDLPATGCPALLVEPSATNLVPSGTTFNSLTGVQTSGVTDSPASAISGTLVTKNEASGTIRYASQNCSTSALSASTTYVISRFFKYNGVDFTTSLEPNTAGQWGGTSWRQNIVLSAASGVTLGTSTNCTGSVENYGNGWYRVSVRLTTGATITGGTPVAYLMLLPAALSTGQGFLTALPQLEASSIATTYIPTTTGSASRNADEITASGSVVSGLIGQTEGTIYAEVDLRNWIASGRILTCSNGTSNERIMIQVGANRTLQAIVTTASADVANISTASGQVNGVYKCALTYASGDFAFYVNGTQIGTDSSGGVPACTSVFLGKIETSASTNFLTDRIRAAALYTTRLSNDQLATLTS